MINDHRPTPLSAPLASLPGSDEQIASHITSLLLHYWVGEMSDSARRSMANDWISDLREFGPQIVGEACERWRHQPGGRRPTPGDIRTYCLDLQRDRQSTVPIDMEAYARSMGFASHLERMDAIQESKRRMLAGDWNHPERGPSAVRGFKMAGAALGLTVREYTADEMRAGRVAAGIEDAEP